MLLVRRATVAHDDVHANGNEWYVLPILRVGNVSSFASDVAKNMVYVQRESEGTNCIN